MLITQRLFVYTKAQLFPTKVSKSNVTKLAKLTPYQLKVRRFIDVLFLQDLKASS